MTTDIKDLISQAVSAQQQPAIPLHVAANICKMLERIQVTGVEAIAWVEAYQHMQRLGAQGPGVPFVPPAG
jgi:hypothetical protein